MKKCSKFAESAESSTFTNVWQKIGRLDAAAESAESAESPDMNKLVASSSMNPQKIGRIGIAIESAVTTQSIFAESAESATFTIVWQKLGRLDGAAESAKTAESSTFANAQQK